jgi:hypothetical protein
MYSIVGYKFFTTVCSHSKFWPYEANLKCPNLTLNGLRNVTEVQELNYALHQCIRFTVTHISVMLSQYVLVIMLWIV